MISIQELLVKDEWYVATDLFDDAKPQAVWTFSQLGFGTSYVSCIDVRDGARSAHGRAGCTKPHVADSEFFNAVRDALFTLKRRGVRLFEEGLLEEQLRGLLVNSVCPSWETCRDSVQGGVGYLTTCIDRYGGSSTTPDPQLDGVPFRFARAEESTVRSPALGCSRSPDLCVLAFGAPLPCGSAHPALSWDRDVPPQKHGFPLDEAALTNVAYEQLMISQTLSAERDVSIHGAWGPSMEDNGAAVLALQTNNSYEGSDCTPRSQPPTHMRKLPTHTLAPLAQATALPLHPPHGRAMPRSQTRALTPTSHSARPSGAAKVACLGMRGLWTAQRAHSWTLCTSASLRRRPWVVLRSFARARVGCHAFSRSLAPCSSPSHSHRPGVGNSGPRPQSRRTIRASARPTMVVAMSRHTLLPWGRSGTSRRARRSSDQCIIRSLSWQTSRRQTSEWRRLQCCAHASPTSSAAAALRHSCCTSGQRRPPITCVHMR